MKKIKKRQKSSKVLLKSVKQCKQIWNIFERLKETLALCINEPIRSYLWCFNTWDRDFINSVQNHRPAFLMGFHLEAQMDGCVSFPGVHLEELKLELRKKIGLLDHVGPSIPGLTNRISKYFKIGAYLQPNKLKINQSPFGYIVPPKRCFENIMAFWRSTAWFLFAATIPKPQPRWRWQKGSTRASLPPGPPSPRCSGRNDPPKTSLFCSPWSRQTNKVL